MKSSPSRWIVGSLIALIALITITIQMQSPVNDSLIVLVAASQRVPIERAVTEYQTRTGQAIELRYGGSQELLGNVRLNVGTRPPDVFLPADASYIELLRTGDYIESVSPLGQMRAALLVAQGRSVTNWAELIRPNHRIALANPGSAAIGKLTQTHLLVSGRWNELQRCIAVRTGTVTESANAAKLGSVDAAIIWDAMAGQYPGLALVRLPELDGIVARVEVAILKHSLQPEKARQFVDYLTDSTAGLRFFRDAGVADSGVTP